MLSMKPHHGFRSLLVFCALTIFAVPALSREVILYHRLMLMDLDQMAKIVADKIKASEAAGGDNESVPLEEAYFTVYSRPDEDGTIEKVVGPLRNKIDELNAREYIIDRLLTEAVSIMKLKKGVTPQVAVTYWVLIENIMGEMKANYDEAGSFEEKQFQKVKDAKIKISSALVNERALRMLKSTKSPSEAATKVLEDFQALNEKQAKEKDAEKQKDSKK